MPIPLATTAITVYGRRPFADVDPDADGYDTDRPPPSIVVADVPACISGPSVTIVDGAEVERWQLRADQCDISQWDYVLDQTDGRYFKVTKANVSGVTLFNLDHVHCELSATSGLPSEGGDRYDA